MSAQGPQYGDPAFGSPTYGPPPAPVPPYPMPYAPVPYSAPPAPYWQPSPTGYLPPSPPPPTRSTAGVWVAALVTLVLIAGGAGALVFLRPHGAPYPAATRPAPTEDIALERSERLTIPTQVGQYQKLVDPKVDAQIAESEAQLKNTAPNVKQA